MKNENSIGIFTQNSNVVFVLLRKEKADNESKAPKINLRSYNASEMLTFLDSAGNLTGAQAACASINSLGRAVNDSLNSLYIGLPCSVRTSV